MPTHNVWQPALRSYLPLTKVKSHTTILSSASETTLTQTFVNSGQQSIDEVYYTFPLYDGVSVVAFSCIIGEKKLIGRVKEKEQARRDYEAAKDRGETAGLLSQLQEASDAFNTKIGNVPANSRVHIEIIYVGELKHDIGSDCLRFTIPTTIAPRHGTQPPEMGHSISSATSLREGIEFVIDVVTEERSPIRQISSPSHPISVTIGQTSDDRNEDTFLANKGSATLALDETTLEDDFVILVLAKDADVPKALLENHPTISQQRCLMTTLVPKFKLPQAHPEIVFVVDRSGSMLGTKMQTVVRALNVLLKSLPVGVKFNICSFGSRYDFLWSKSKTYNKTNLDEAITHVNTIEANYGGTEMLQPITATVKNRFKDLQLEVIVLTDGEIWNQQELFDFITESAANQPARFFSLGIGSRASSSLVEGIASAGQGFSQFVAENEKLEQKMIRLLKGALSPRIVDYKLEFKYEKESDDGYELISVAETMVIDAEDQSKSEQVSRLPTISLFNKSAEKEEDEKPTGPVDRYAHLPRVPNPRMLQAPYRIPSLFPFNRTTIFIMISPEMHRRKPTSVVLRGTSDHGPLELEIDIQDVGQGTMLHQLAAKKAMQELEQGRGWLTDATNKENSLLKDVYPGRWDEIVEREAVRLGVSYQVAGKFCSFVALEKRSSKDVETGGDAFEQPSYQKFVNMKHSTRSNNMPTSNPKAAPFGAGVRFSETRRFGQDTNSSFQNTTSGGALFGTAAAAASSPSSGLASIQGSASARPPANVFGQQVRSQRRQSPAAIDSRNRCRTGPFNQVDPSFTLDFGELDSVAQAPIIPIDPTILAQYQQEMADAPALPLPLSRSDRMHALIRLQNFNGSWHYSTELSTILLIDFDHDPDLVAKTDVVATAAAIAFFETVVASEEGTWELVVQKALGWLEGEVGGEVAAREMKKKFVSVVRKAFEGLDDWDDEL